MKKIIKTILNALIIILLLGLVLYFSLKDNYDEIISIIRNVKIIYLIIGAIFLVIYRYLIGLSMHILVKNNKENISILKSFQISFIILFFHAVTPFATGGQPMEVYYLHKEKIPVEKGTNIVLQNFILYQSALILVGLITIILNYIIKIFPFNSLMRKLVILGFIINTVVWLVSVLLAYGKQSGKILIEVSSKILFKLKIIKDKEEYLNKLNNYADNFYNSAESLVNNKKIILQGMIINILALIILYSIPYILSKGFNNCNINLLESLIATSYVMVIGGFVPIPGGTGGMEYAFMYFFNYLIKGSLLSALMLTWRFITYYMGMIIGAIVLIFNRKRSIDNE